MNVQVLENIYNEVLRNPRSTANGAEEWELGRECSKMLCSTVNYWYTILFLEQDKLLECCYYWKAGTLKWESSVISLKDKPYKTVLGYIWLQRQGSNSEYTCKIITTRCINIQRQSSREKIREKKSLISYWNMKINQGR
jgi:hypothetical protein